MSDYKSGYSDESKNYIDNKVPNSELDQGRYNRSKDREAKFNANWLRRPVNINDVVDRFVPADEAKVSGNGVKLTIEGKRYQVICDKVAGYLRIKDKKLNSFCKADGTPTSKDDNENTHFKIMKRKEMK